LAALSEALKEGRPVGQESVLTNAETISRVEQFLTTLYSALDASHQQVEKALRGELYEMQERTPLQIRFEPADGVGDVSPPFGAGGRSFGGDPEAIALQGDSAVGDIEQSWEDFSAKLNSTAKKAELQAEIERLKNLAAAYQTAIDATLAGPNTPPPADLQAKLDDVLQDLAYAEQQLAVLNQEYP